MIDMLCEGARAPINLQKGNFVPQGGSLAVEIKAAKSSYFRSELEGGHLLHQVAGHRVADAGMVITTKDIKDAYRESPAILRDGARSTLREAGSPLFCFLPAKDQLDQAMKDLLQKHMS